MGGICGSFGEQSGAVCGAMIGRLAHRGRAASASIRQGRATLGHVLGEVLPSAAVATSEDGRIACVLDGRLLDARELAAELSSAGVPRRAGTSAEIVADMVMLHGAPALERLDGPYALALATEDELILARDALGEKPLYFARVGGDLVFASEIKALLAHPAFRVEPDPASLLRLLVFSFIPGEQTMFRGVSELEPGTMLRARDPAATPEITRTWRLEERALPGDEASFVARTADLARRAVARRLPDEGPVGAFLSGGVDSSAVVALLKEQGARMIAYSVAFGAGQPNEIGFARMVTEHCDVEHRVLDVDPSMFLDLLPSVIHSLDDPLCDCITVPNFLLAREAARDVRVVFNGEGGDPLFGGPKNKFMILGEWYAFLGGYDRAAAYLGSYHKLYEHLDELCTPELLAAGGGSEALRALVRPYLDDEGMQSFLNRLMHANVKLKGGQNILVKVDKMLSANGLEPASPLFDRRLAELSFEIPPGLKRRGDVEKYVFKKAVEDLLPRPVVYRKKAGMGVPLNFWFRKTGLRDLANDLLGSSRFRQRGWFQQPFVDRLLRGEPPSTSIGQDRSGEMLWMLLSVELWHRVFMDGEAP